MASTSDYGWRQGPKAWRHLYNPSIRDALASGFARSAKQQDLEELMPEYLEKKGVPQQVTTVIKEAVGVIDDLLMKSNELSRDKLVIGVENIPSVEVAKERAQVARDIIGKIFDKTKVIIEVSKAAQEELMLKAADFDERHKAISRDIESTKLELANVRRQKNMDEQEALTRQLELEKKAESLELLASKNIEAFADMRKSNEELERELNELEKAKENAVSTGLKTQLDLEKAKSTVQSLKYLSDRKIEVMRKKNAEMEKKLNKMSELAIKMPELFSQGESVRVEDIADVSIVKDDPVAREQLEIATTFERNLHGEIDAMQVGRSASNTLLMINLPVDNEAPTIANEPNPKRDVALDAAKAFFGDNASMEFGTKMRRLSSKEAEAKMSYKMIPNKVLSGIYGRTLYINVPTGTKPAEIKEIVSEKFNELADTKFAGGLYRKWKEYNSIV